MYLLGLELPAHRICVCSELGNSGLSLPKPPVVFSATCRPVEHSVWQAAAFVHLMSAQCGRAVSLILISFITEEVKQMFSVILTGYVGILLYEASPLTVPIFSLHCVFLL